MSPTQDIPAFFVFSLNPVKTDLNAPDFILYFSKCWWLRSRYVPAWPDVPGQRQDPCIESVIIQTLEDLILEMCSSRQASPSRVGHLPSICLGWQPR